MSLRRSLPLSMRAMCLPRGCLRRTASPPPGSLQAASTTRLTILWPRRFPSSRARRGHEQGLDITLEKNLPVAAGLGGGSADAGAVFRLVERRHGLPDDWQARAAKLGADLPCCVRSETVIGRGTGTQLEPIESDLAGTPVLLVNPREPLATGPVFKAWDGKDRGALPGCEDGKISNARHIATHGRNDLTEAAISLKPAVAAVLTQLTHDKPWLTRMSGSGATCFALYDTIEDRDAAAERIARAHPDWWQLAGKLR